MKRTLILAAVLILIPIAAYAVDPVNAGEIDKMMDSFKAKTGAWAGPLQTMAAGTFGILTVVDLVVYVGIPAMLAGARGEISEFAHSLVRETILLSFFAFVLTGFKWIGPLIIEGFQYAAKQAGGAPTQPSQIFAAGINIGGTVFHSWSFLHPGDSITMALCGVVIMGCFGLICTGMIYVIVESYFIVSGGQILMLFGGIRLTQDIVTALLRNNIAIGLKLFAMQLVASVGTAFVLDWASTIHIVSFEGVLVIIGESFILAALTISVPIMFSRMIGNIALGGAHNILSAAAAITGAAVALTNAARSLTISAAGMAAATYSAAELAVAQNLSESGPATGALAVMERAASIIGSTAGNLVSSKLADMQAGLTGQRGNAGSSPWRMTHRQQEQLRLGRERASRPPPPASPSTGGTP